MFAVSKAAYIDSLVQGSQRYWAFPFSKISLLLVVDFINSVALVITAPEA